MTSKFSIDNRELLQRISSGEAVVGIDFGNLIVRELAAFRLAAMGSRPHTDDELSNLLWYSQEATCHSDPNYYCEFQRLATPGLIAGIIRELQERRKADREPVILYRQVNPVNGMKTYWAELDPEEFRHLKQHTDENAEFMTLYRHAQPAPERDQVRSAHAEWSQATFGNVGPVGPLKHLSKEALEAAEQPSDLSEWADMQFLLWDAQRRAGITDDQITQAMIDKLAVNKQRSWPEPKDGEPRLHIKGQPAPVVPDDYQRLRELYHAQEKRLFKIAQRIKGPAFDKYSHSPSQAIDVLEGAIFGEDGACRAAMLAAAPQPVKGGE